MIDETNLALPLQSIALSAHPLRARAPRVASRRASAYRRRWAERFGFFDPPPLRSPVWVHAVSVGEVLAAVPLIQWLRERGVPVLVTTTTPTGAERVRAAFGADELHL